MSVPAVRAALPRYEQHARRRPFQRREARGICARNMLIGAKRCPYVEFVHYDPIPLPGAEDDMEARRDGG